MAGCKELSDKTHTHTHGILTKLEKLMIPTVLQARRHYEHSEQILLHYIQQHQQNAQ
jgi:hypothetical protein